MARAKMDGFPFQAKLKSKTLGILAPSRLLIFRMSFLKISDGQRPDDISLSGRWCIPPS